MNIQPRLTGITTPSSETLQRLIDVKYGRAPLPEEGLRSMYARDTTVLMGLQSEEGFEMISDGQHHWGDLFRPVYEGMDGVAIGSQTRWYETNGFCFPPRIIHEPKAGNPNIGQYLAPSIAALEGLGKKLTLTLPGPYTLLRMAENTPSLPKDMIMTAFAEHLARMVRSLPASVGVIEFTEPSWGYDRRANVNAETRNRTVALAREAYARIVPAATPQRKVILQLPHADFTAHPEVLSIPVPGYGIDLTETVSLSSDISLSGKTLSAGILDAWSSTPEDLDYAEKRMRAAIDAWKPAQVEVTTNAQLFHTISYEPAMNRVRELAELARRLRA